MSPETIYGVLALIIVLILATATAKVASDKGSSALVWFIAGMLLPGVALVVALFLDEQMFKECPRCAKRVRRGTRVCGFCSYHFTPRDDLRQ
ncbi:MAG TPA: hypothetical protein VGW77_13540 [Candidatus Binatia bacterium]|nr:hypothetical protein [Candidatus Binatia bacterium]